MTGATLKKFVAESGLRPQVIYEAAGLNREHYYKILAKKDVSVEDLERIARAIGRRPGDLLDNSFADIVPLLPLVAELKRFAPDAHERVREILRNTASLLEESIARSEAAHGVQKRQVYTSASKFKSDELREAAGLNGASSAGDPDARSLGGAIEKHTPANDNDKNR